MERKQISYEDLTESVLEQHESTKQILSNEVQESTFDERMIFDEKLGLLYDTITGLYYDSSTNLFYDINSGVYMEVARPLQEIINNAKRERKEKKRKNKKSRRSKSRSRSHSRERRDRSRSSSRDRKHRSRSSSRERRDRSRSSSRERRSDSKSASETESKEEEKEEKENKKEMEYDETSGNYYDKKTGLYYHPNENLYYNYSSFPPSSYHFNNSTGEFLQVYPDSIYKLEETPSRYLLIQIDEEGNPIKEYLIGESLIPSKVMKSISTIGRDKKNTIVVSDLEASKKHANIIWENVYFKNFFWLVDVGSRNGTFLNQQRISESNQSSNEKDFPIYHGDYIKIGNVTFVVEKVPEEYLKKAIQEANAAKTEEERKEFASTEESVKALRKMLRLNYRERRERESFNTKYQDRAAKRRKVLKGVPENSKVPIPEQIKISNVAYGTEQMSMKKEIPENNAGFKLLQSMGWQKGKGLGKENTGIVAPISVEPIQGRRGLGFGNIPADFEEL